MRFSPISMIGYYGIRLKIWSLAFHLRVHNYKRSFHTVISPECHGVFNHQQRACLFNSSCRITPKKLSKLHLVLVLGTHLWPVDSTHKGAAVDIVYMSSCHTKVLDWATHLHPPVGSGTPAFKLGSRIDPHLHRGVVKVHWRVPWVGGLFSWVVATFTLLPPGMFEWPHLFEFGVMCCMLSTCRVLSRIVANISETSLLFSK